MDKRSDLVTMGGNPITLIGTEVKTGEPAPDFEVVDNNLNPVKFSSFKGKVCVISAVPSLDTPICDLQTRHFDKDLGQFDFDVEFLTISMDLPFAQQRWCGAAGTQRVKALSDYQNASFGLAYGVLIEGLRLLARTVFVVDQEGIIKYIQLVKEIKNEPDYDDVLAAIKKLG